LIAGDMAEKGHASVAQNAHGSCFMQRAT